MVFGRRFFKKALLGKDILVHILTDEATVSYDPYEIAHDTPCDARPHRLRNTKESPRPAYLFKGCWSAGFLHLQPIPPYLQSH